MISAVVLAHDDIAALGATLAALVPAVAEGVVRDAVVVDASRSQEVRREVRQIAEATGAAHVAAAAGADPWRLGAEAARGPWLLLLEAGDVPDPTWRADAERFLLTAGPSAARANRAAVFARAGGGGWLARLRSWLPQGGFAPRAGMVCPKAALRGVAGSHVRVVVLGARIPRLAPAAPRAAGG